MKIEANLKTIKKVDDSTPKPKSKKPKAHKTSPKPKTKKQSKKTLKMLPGQVLNPMIQQILSFKPKLLKTTE